MDKSLLNDVVDPVPKAPADRLTQPFAYSLRNFFIATGLMVALIFGAAWPWAAYGRMWFMDPEWAMWTAKMQIVKECDQGDTIILGDSRAMAGLIPATMGDNVTNLALGGGTQIENYYTARRALACPAPLKRALISFLPIDISRNQVYWERTAQFGFLDFDEMEEVRKTSLRVQDPLIYHDTRVGTLLDIVRNFSYRISFPPYYTPAMINAHFVGRRGRNEREIDATLRDRGHHYFGTSLASNAIADDAEQRKFTPSPIMMDYLDRVLTLLRDNDADVYFVTPPLNPATFEHMSPEVVASFKSLLAAIAKRHPNFHVLGDVVYSRPADHFGDLEHLNVKGATAWSEEIKNLLAKAEP
ncbi:hypothetical protein [Hyphomicrobium sp. CS1GBMeth3]|uniref:hypothetical protein n=1 Tax=Hyphomicrobium sp. CS1GBMeth3 TaxID=1892845 RepID=UPI00093191DC|nr:hypothetical protein [Hyphomicrobium sp. CS1GBMeth3]